MKAVVVYESMYGNTHQVADAIGTGLENCFEVRVVPVSHADHAVLADADLVVVGGPDACSRDEPARHPQGGSRGGGQAGQPAEGRAGRAGPGTA